MLCNDDILNPSRPAIILLPSHSTVNWLSEHRSFKCASLRQQKWEARLYSWSPSSGHALATMSPPEAESNPAPADYQGCQLYWTFVRIRANPLSDCVMRNIFALYLTLALTGVNHRACRWENETSLLFIGVRRVDYKGHFEWNLPRFFVNNFVSFRAPDSNDPRSVTSFSKRCQTRMAIQRQFCVGKRQFRHPSF